MRCEAELGVGISQVVTVFVVFVVVVLVFFVMKCVDCAGGSSTLHVHLSLSPVAR